MSNDYPGEFFLRPDALAVAEYLQSRNWLRAGETVQSVERAGEGNMNCVLRVRSTVGSSERSLILKQSRPWVEKYPSIAAPWERALWEARFYEVVATVPVVAGFLPALLGFDTGEYLLVLEDLGAAQDFSFLYAGGSLEEAVQRSLLDFLVALHSSFRSPELAGRFENRAMRRLNHEHIFALPLRAHNGLDLDAITRGLGALAEQLMGDRRYVEAVAALGEHYLAQEGDCLIHGDFFPGSWMKPGERIRVIDPEFCFYGLAEWDLGVMAAHLYLTGHSESRVAGLLAAYERQAPLDTRLAGQFAGVEIMRRLIGVAQLPLAADLGRKAEWLALSRSLVLENES